MLKNNFFIYNRMPNSEQKVKLSFYSLSGEKCARGYHWVPVTPNYRTRGGARGGPDEAGPSRRPADTRWASVAPHYRTREGARGGPDKAGPPGDLRASIGLPSRPTTAPEKARRAARTKPGPPKDLRASIGLPSRKGPWSSCSRLSLASGHRPRPRATRGTSGTGEEGGHEGIRWPSLAPPLPHHRTTAPELAREAARTKPGPPGDLRTPPLASVALHYRTTAPPHYRTTRARKFYTLHSSFSIPPVGKQQDGRNGRKGKGPSGLRQMGPWK